MTTLDAAPSQGLPTRPLPQQPQAAAAARRVWLPAALASTAVAWGGNQFTPLLGPYETLRGLDQITVNMLLFAYVGGIVPALFLAARLQRRFHPRTLVAGAVALGLVGSILLATAGDHVGQLVAGRVLSGIALASGMVNGGAWIRRLVLTSGGVTSASLARTARVSALSLTTGFGLGAGAAGLLAYAAPAPLVSAYVPHMLLAVVTLVVIVATRRHTSVPAVLPPPAPAAGGEHGHPGLGRLLLTVLPVAPWIFGSLGLAYAVLPQRLAATHGPVSVIYLTLLCTTALTCGFFIQQAVRRVRLPLRFPAPTLGMVLVIGTLVVAAWRLPLMGPVELWVMSGLLGTAYGLVISGLLVRIQLSSPPRTEALMTALLYTFAYTGFGLPVTLSWASTWAGYSVLLYGVAALAVPLTVIAHVAGRRLRPHPSHDRAHGTDRAAA
ncbi:Major Facilitator Superfamily protein [Raineyella antarctica]|uniref:Major Facilitator Superfamily protein n=1 Tax=Raineyella antarctica TaxID=1577474 RepID=A0A1G6H3C9_9ACTN|nr:MFS transporter [Raineyella antarctica]SDB88807.1 Major Facilitator Superfamily protein [Raineyella antarctica]